MPANAFWSATPSVASLTDDSGWYHCIAPQLGSCVMTLLTASVTGPVAIEISWPWSAKLIGAGVTCTIVPTTPFDSSLAMATSAMRCAGFARSST